MPIKETSSKEEYLFTEYRRGTSLLGVKDTGNPIALGLALAPVTFGLSLVAGLTESSERKKINKERFDKTYERQCVGEIVERNQFNFASVIKETNIKQKDYSFDFICPYCNRIIQSFSRDSNITFFEFIRKIVVMLINNFIGILKNQTLL